MLLPDDWISIHPELLDRVKELCTHQRMQGVSNEALAEVIGAHMDPVVKPRYARLVEVPVKRVRSMVEVISKLERAW